jgi:hypothetical protein
MHSVEYYNFIREVDQAYYTSFESEYFVTK